MSSTDFHVSTELAWTGSHQPPDRYFLHRGRLRQTQSASRVSFQPASSLDAAWNGAEVAWITLS